MTQNPAFETPQEQFWADQFGSEYIRRNESPELLASNVAFFSRSLRQASAISSAIELGANVGLNLKALQSLYPHAQLTGVEINRDAASVLAETIGKENVHCGSIFDVPTNEKWELTFTKGVLIHIHPGFLSRAYDKLYAASSRYVLVCEYYNPSPISLEYRGHRDRLFKRDFAGEMLDRYEDLRLIDYGFAYHRDHAFPQDDITWFLMEKTSA